MVYWAQSWQDEFVANLLNFKRNGFYLDIGSGPADAQSNSNFFDSELGWKGVCVEQSDYSDFYKEKRTCHFINEDATKVDYKSVLDAEGYPKRIDYLSIDIDEGSANALKAIPFDHYKFSIITIEHDAYRFGDSLREEERRILNQHNYHPLFLDVLVPLGCGMGPDLPYEDWWVDLSAFNVDKISNFVVKLANDKLYPDHIVDTLKNIHDIFTV